MPRVSCQINDPGVVAVNGVSYFLTCQIALLFISDWLIKTIVGINNSPDANGKNQLPNPFAAPIVVR